MTEKWWVGGPDGPCDGAPVPPMTRRHLLGWGASAAVIASLPPLVAAPAAVGRTSWLQRATYARHLGEWFRAELGGGRTVALRLMAVEDLVGTTPSGTSLAGRDDAFLLVLRGPDAPRLTQGVRQLRHVALGSGGLFLVPEARRSNETTYAVVVNRADR
jgi:hypothetical protein